MSLTKWLADKLEISHGSNTPLLSMEGLRGVAVFLVFWVHYSSLIDPWVAPSTQSVLDFVHNLGHLGVDLFFVLSGYLIYGSVVNKTKFSASRYAARRVQRIYPTFLVVLAIYLFLSWAFPNESKLPIELGDKLKYIVKNLLLLPGVFDMEPIVTVAWSLSYEAFYYLLIPVLIFSLRMNSWEVQRRIIFWLLVASFGFVAFYSIEGPVRLLMFISGILLFELHSKLEVRARRGGTLLLIVALVFFGCRSIWDINYIAALVVVFVLFLYHCLCAFNPESLSYRWLTYTPLRWLGNMSYSYYLIHGLTLKFAFLVIGLVVTPEASDSYLYYWLWAPLFLMTLLSSFVLFLLVERPLSLVPPKNRAVLSEQLEKGANSVV